MTPDRLPEIEARAERATPGPWRIEEDWTAELFAADGALIGKFIYPHRMHDAVFIAAARSDVPWLCAELRRERERAERLTSVLARYGRHIGTCGYALYGPPAICTCGFDDAARQAIGGKSDDE